MKLILLFTFMITLLWSSKWETAIFRLLNIFRTHFQGTQATKNGEFFEGLNKQARKGFRPPSAMKGMGYFQNLRNLLKDFFWRNFLGEIFWRIFFGRIFLGGFFGRIFWVDFLGGILCLHTLKLTCLSRFCLNKEGQ